MLRSVDGVCWDAGVDWGRTGEVEGEGLGERGWPVEGVDGGWLGKWKGMVGGDDGVMGYAG